MLLHEINTPDSINLQERFKAYRESIKNRPIYDKIYMAVYANRKHIKNSKQLRVTEVIRDIMFKTERKNVADKNDLPVGYFSVVKFNGRKTEKNVSAHTGLIVIDIDKKDNPILNFEQLKENMLDDKYIYAYFDSPSGGLKVIVNTNIKAIGHHYAYYENIRNYILTKYTNITKIDTSGSNINRACYLPYDPFVYFNSSALKYSIEDRQVEESIAKKAINKQIRNLSKPLLQIDSISYDEHYVNILNLLKKRTEIGLYSNIFNDYRFINIEQAIMDTSVPLMELIILKKHSPVELDWSTRLDEYYFKDNPQKQLNIMNLGCTDGLEVCTIGFKKDYKIKEHYRAKTLGSFTMKLIFNNPFCHPDYLLKEVNRINNYFSEDPNPVSNPKPDEEEVRNIVMLNYYKFINGELDFSTVIRKKSKTKAVSKKFVFKSKQYLSIDRSIAHLEAVRAYHEGKNAKSKAKFEEAIYILQDGKKVTQKRIAYYLGVSTRTVRRYMVDDYIELIRKYNSSVKLSTNSNKKTTCAIPKSR